MGPHVTYRISGLTAGLMISIAVFVDSLQIISLFLLALGVIPVVGTFVFLPMGAAFAVASWLLSIVAWILFLLWFFLLGVPFLLAGGNEGDTLSGITNTVGAMFGVVVESIPGFNLIPIFSIVVTKAVFASRKADRKKSTQ